jgi:hypothetical protein
VNKWADIKQRRAAPADQAEQPLSAARLPWTDPDRAVLDHMREILGGSLFDGCGQPDCFDCAED